MKWSALLLAGGLVACTAAEPPGASSTEAARDRPPSPGPTIPAPSAPAGTQRLRAEDLAGIEPLVREALAEGRMPGCVVAVGDARGLIYQRAFGHRALRPEPEPMTLDTVFDLASLTKPVATATAVLQLVEQGRVRLRDPVARHWPAFAEGGKEAIRVEQLLLHVGGLIPDNALEDYRHGPEEAWRRLAALAPVDPPGTSFRYSDVGFEALGRMVEEVTGRPLDQVVRESLFEPLGMHETGFRPPVVLRERAAPTEQRDGHWMRGEVHDPRAFLLGGVAGHAGLFSTAADLARFARALLQGGSLDGARILSPAGVAAMTAAVEVPRGTRTLGWDHRSPYSSNRGETFSDAAFGHGGFTGTTLWIDPKLDLFVLFLSNRVHPDGKGSVNDLAGRIGTLAGAAASTVRGRARLDGQRPALRPSLRPAGVFDPAPFAARLGARAAVGLDVLVASDFAALPPGRVGLVTNHTGIDREGRRNVDLLFEAPEVDLVLLFSPEHGLGGDREGRVGDAEDAGTGLPIFSLYGDSKVPRAQVLHELDVLVFDIQDAGTRFYTYLSTMGLCLEACAAAGVHFVVLDRPNPLGERCAGPVRDASMESFVAHHAVPVRHGMTAGEIALLCRAERCPEAALTVVPCRGIAPDAFFDQTGLPWVNPSPNLRTVHQALLYPGIGLLEFTNLSVGRGTDTPFERIGAPWLDGVRLAEHLRSLDLPGLRFTPVRFTPTTSKFEGEECGGVHILISDRRRVEPVRLGLEIACALRDGWGDAWDDSRFDTLLAHPATLRRFRAGEPALRLLELVESERAQFRLRRQPYLLPAAPR